MSERPRSEFETGATISSNAIYAFAAQLSTAVFTAAITVFLVRELGPEEYGIFALALSVAAVAILPSDLGVSWSTARFLAEHRHDRDSVIGVIRLGFRVKVIAGLAISGLLFALAEPIAGWYSEPSLAWPIRAVAVAMFAQALMQFVYTVLIALQRLKVGFRIVLFEAAMELTATVVLVLVFTGAAAATWGRAIGYGLGATLALVLLARTIGGLRDDGQAKSPVNLRPFLLYAGAIFVIDAAFTVFSQIDVLLIGSIIGTTAAGLFSAPLRLIPFLSYPGLALARAVAPTAAGGSSAGASADALQSALRLIVVLQMLLVAGIVVWAEPIVNLTLGADYADSTAVLRALAPFVFLLGMAPLVSLPINFAGAARRRIPVAVGTIALNIVLDLILIPKIGIVAGAISTDISFFIYVAVHLWLCRDILGVRLGPLASSFARCTIAALCVAGLLAALGTAELTALDWAAGMVLAPAVYVGALVALRELTLGELRSAARRSRSLLDRGRTA